MPGRDIIVIGASAGGVEPVLQLAKSLPPDLPASLFVVIHTSPNSPGVLPRIIDRAGPLICRHPEDGETFRPGHIYVAPPDRHMLIKGEKILVTHGPKENGFRPAVDPLFRTAARSGGARTVGVVLSGGLDDGALGVVTVKQHGGVAIVQDPDDAIFPGMPTSAMENAPIDHVLAVAQMAAMLVQLATEEIPDEDLAMARRNRLKGHPPDVAEVGSQALSQHAMDGPPSGLTCPDCGGALWEVKEEKLLRFRCHVGHAFTAKSLEAEQVRDLEVALWGAVRALEESASLYRRMADRLAVNAITAIADRYERQAQEAEHRASVIRQVITAKSAETPEVATGGNSVESGPVASDDEEEKQGKDGGNGRQSGRASGKGPSTSSKGTKKGTGARNAAAAKATRRKGKTRRTGY